MQAPSQIRTLLVVDDDFDTRHAIHEVLEECGYRVATAPDGEDALVQLLHGLRPDVVLVDLCMPVMDDWTFVARLREQSLLAHIPVVVMTAANPRLMNVAPASTTWVSKPIDLNKLVETLESCHA